MPDTKIPEIKKTYSPTGDEQKAREWVYKRFDEMKLNPARIAAEKTWKAGQQAWEALRPEKASGDWMSNYYIPLTTSVVESILAEFVDQQQRPLILPRGEEDIPRAMIMRHIYDYTWEVADGDLELINIFKTGLIKGTAIAQEYYLKDRRLIKQILGLNKASKGLPDRFETEEKEVFEYDDVYMEEVPLEEIWFDEKAVEVNRGSRKARDCVRRYTMNIRDFRQFFTGPVWDPANHANMVRPGTSVGSDYFEYYKPSTNLGAEDVEVLWYWSRKPEDSLIVVANDVVMRMGPNIMAHKQLPFAKAVDVNRVGCFYGKGEPELLDSIQEELNTLRRMTIDRHHLDLDKSFLVSSTAMLDDDDLMARPHQVIEVDDPNNVKALEYGDIPSSVQITQKNISEDAVRVTGVDDRFQSIQKTPSTATEAAILKESTLKRIKMKITLLQKGFLTDVARQRVYNIMQFYSQPRLERIVGENNTKQYKEKLMDLTRRGMVTLVDGKPMEMKYRQIRLDGKKIAKDEKGGITEQATDGYSFFEVHPDDFFPTKGGFDIKFEGGATLTISKPLMQSKAIEMFDRLLPLTATTNYDPEKLGDYLVKINDMNPDEFKKVEVAENQNIAARRLEMAVKLAAFENQSILDGKPIAPNGTPYAPPAHTELHIAFLRSQAMLSAPQDLYDKLVAHISGEMAAIEQRSSQAGLSGGPVQPGLPQSGEAGDAMGMNANNQMANTLPSKIQGGGEVPTGQAVNPTA